MNTHKHFDGWRYEDIGSGDGAYHMDLGAEGGVFWVACGRVQADGPDYGRRWARVMDDMGDHVSEVYCGDDAIDTAIAEAGRLWDDLDDEGVEAALLARLEGIEIDGWTGRRIDTGGGCFPLRFTHPDHPTHEIYCTPHWDGYGKIAVDAMDDEGEIYGATWWVDFVSIDTPIADQIAEFRRVAAAYILKCVALFRFQSEIPTHHTDPNVVPVGWAVDSTDVGSDSICFYQQLGPGQRGRFWVVYGWTTDEDGEPDIKETWSRVVVTGPEDPDVDYVRFGGRAALGGAFDLAARLNEQAIARNSAEQ